MDEIELACILRRWAKPDPAFREDLLQRCLAVIGEGKRKVLDDETLNLLAAAGDGFPSFDSLDDPLYSPRDYSKE